MKTETKRLATNLRVAELPSSGTRVIPRPVWFPNPGTEKFPLFPIPFYLALVLKYLGPRFKKNKSPLALLLACRVFSYWEVSG